MTYLIRLYLNESGKETFESGVLDLTAENREDIKKRLWLFSSEWRSFDIYEKKPTDFRQTVEREYIDEYM